MNVMQPIHRRRAVRDYTGQGVGRRILESLRDPAIWAPSVVGNREEYFAALPVVVGYAGSEPPRTERNPPEIVAWR